MSPLLEIVVTDEIPTGASDQSASTRPSAPSEAQWERPPSFAVQLEFFSGPMDLLLHLVHQREVPIEKVDLREICSQYLEIINRAAVLDLEKATEYLVIAATLISLKSQSLLPANTAEEESSQEPYDTRFYESLRERLAAYELAKNRAQALLGTPQLGIDKFTRTAGPAVPRNEEFVIESEQTEWLGELFMGLLKRIGELGKKFMVRLEPVSVVNMMMKFIERLEVKRGVARGPSSFLNLVRSVGARELSPAMARSSVIGGFIAVLELAKRGVMRLEQNEGENDFRVALHLTGEVNEDELTASLTAAENNVIPLDAYRTPPEQVPAREQFVEGISG